METQALIVRVIAGDAIKEETVIKGTGKYGKEKRKRRRRRREKEIKKQKQQLKRNGW